MRHLAELGIRGARNQALEKYCFPLNFGITGSETVITGFDPLRPFGTQFASGISVVILMTNTTSTA